MKQITQTRVLYLIHCMMTFIITIILICEGYSLGESALIIIGILLLSLFSLGPSMKQMNREEFEAYIKGLSVDEMIQMMPGYLEEEQRHHLHIGKTIWYRVGYYDNNMLPVYAHAGDKLGIPLYHVLLWLYDNNLLPEYTKDE